jgi:hypothetical protein
VIHPASRSQLLRASGSEKTRLVAVLLEEAEDVKEVNGTRPQKESFGRTPTYTNNFRGHKKPFRFEQS